jgi:hypothetical protein
VYTIWLKRSRRAVLIFNVEDQFAAQWTGLPHQRPVEPLSFWLVGRDAPPPAETFDPPRRLAVRRNPSGYHLFFGQEQLAGGQKRQMALPDGEYRVRVTSPYYQTLEQTMVIPLPDLNRMDPENPDPALRNPLHAYTMRLLPSAGYTFPDPLSVRPQDFDRPCNATNFPGGSGPTLLRGSLRAAEGQPIVGARVQVPGVTGISTTDENGNWVLWFPNAAASGRPTGANGNGSHPSGPVTVRFVLPDGSTVDVPQVCVVRGYAASLQQAGLRGWARQGSAPIANAVVTVSGQPGSALTDEAGGWAYYFPLDQGEAVVSVTATPPNGPARTQSNIQVRPRAVTLIPTFDLPAPNP